MTSASSTRSSTRSSTSSRCTGSTTSSARKPPRTCTCCGSPTGCSPGAGTASTSSRCRSTCRRRSTSATARSSTTPPARCSTCWSPTCSRWPPRSPWSRRPAWDREDLQAAREEVIGCFRPLDPAEVVLGQFDGYRDVPGIDPHSNQDTFVAARLWIDTDRWRGVPFYLRTGKRDGHVGAAGQPDPARAAGAAERPAAERRQRALLLPGRGRRDRPLPGDQEAGPGAGSRRGARRASRWPPCPARTRCRRTSG